MVKSERTAARIGRFGIVVLAACAATPAARASAPDRVTVDTPQSALYQRPTDVTLIMGNSLRYTGTYGASQLSQTCGELSPEESITGERMFIVEFPYDGTPEITAVSFGSFKLVSGVTTTDQFRLNVNVKAKQGGEPPGFAINTVPPVPKEHGPWDGNAERHSWHYQAEDRRRQRDGRDDRHHAGVQAATQVNPAVGVKTMTSRGLSARWIVVLSTSLGVACSGTSGGSAAATGSTIAGQGQAVPIDAKLEQPPKKAAAPTTAEVLAKIGELKARVPSAQGDVKAQAQAIGSDFRAIFRFVRDQINYEAYSGVLRAADGTLAAGAGNGFDRSLLLSSLLAAVGVPTRFAVCDLPPDRGEALYRHIFDAWRSTGPVAWPDESSGFLKRVVTRARRDYPIIRAAVGGSLTSAGSLARGQAIRDAQRHAWVQANIDGRWIDLDSAFGDAEPGTAHCSANQTVDRMPIEWHQRVTIRIMVERLEDGVLKIAPALTVTMPAVDLVGEAVFLVHVPGRSQGGGLGLGAGSAAASPGLWTPALVIGNEVASGKAVDFSDATGGSGMLDAFGGGGGESALVAEWLDLEVTRPDGRSDVTRRALIDRAGAAWRAARSNDASRLRPIERDDLGPLGPQAIHNILFSAGPHDLTAFADAVAWMVKQGEPNPGASIAATLFPFAVRNFASFVWADHVIIPAVNDQAQVRLYTDSPRVAIVSVTLAKGGGVSEVYDLRRDRLCGLASDAAADPLVVDRKLWFAALEGALEHEAVARDASIFSDDLSKVISTSSLLGPEGVVLLATADSGRLPTLTGDAEKAATLAVALEAKYVVVVPRAALGRAIGLLGDRSKRRRTGGTERGPQRVAEPPGRGDLQSDPQTTATGRQDDLHPRSTGPGQAARSHRGDASPAWR